MEPMPGSSFGIPTWITTYPRLCNHQLPFYVAEFEQVYVINGGY